MSSVDPPNRANERISQTMSFGSHRQSDRPASAQRAGEAPKPPAWQSRGVPSYDQAQHHGAAVRSFGDIALDPLRWAISTKARRIVSAGVCYVVVMGVVF